MPDRPNVVLFISHDTGRFISPYGSHNGGEYLSGIGAWLDRREKLARWMGSTNAEPVPPHDELDDKGVG